MTNNNKKNLSMPTRNEYLKKHIRSRYLKAVTEKNKREKTELLNKAEEVTGLNRKYLMEKLKPKSNLDKKEDGRRFREKYYGKETVPALAQVWRIFDKICGQRLVTSIEEELDKLRREDEIECSDEIAGKLKEMSSSTIDRYLRPVKERELAKKKRTDRERLIYSQVPIKKFSEQDRSLIGFIQADLVNHCGRSMQGQFVNTVSATDIRFGWWEGEAQMGKGQEPTKESLDKCRRRFPFAWTELHPDNDTAILNDHILNYCNERSVEFSRSEAYHKNDNCIVEQKNGKVVREKVGDSRFDTEEELEILLSLYRNELRLYVNFFLPQTRLISKKRVKGKIKRKYSNPKTPYKRIMECSEVSEEIKQELTEIYKSSNPAKLKRRIDAKLDLLFQTYEKKQNLRNGRKTKVEEESLSQEIDDSTTLVSVR